MTTPSSAPATSAGFAPLIEARTTIAASPERVWAIVSDPRVMGGLSDQVVRTVVRGSAPVAEGTRTLNLNRRGPLVWPTRAQVVRFDPPREYAYRVLDNGAIWSFVLTPAGEGTELVHRRETPKGLSKASVVLQQKVLGGISGFEGEMEQGMATTLERVRRLAEAR